MANLEQLFSSLEDTASLINKALINFKKCPKARLTRGYLEARSKILEDYWKSFTKTHGELVKMTTKEQKNVLPYFVNEEYYTYEDTYTTIQGDIKDLLSSLSPTETTTNTNTTQNSFVHLPKIQLPKFNGSYDLWPTFKDLFNSLVHENKTLSDVQKLHYLKTSVEGEAKTLLKHIQVTSTNYALAWKMLGERYENKRLILNSNMKRLFSQRKSTIQSASHLKGLVDTTTETLNNLQNLKFNTDSWDPIIIYLLVQKLDPETHKGWEEHVSTIIKDIPTWPQFKEFLETKFRTLELVTVSSSNTPRETKTVKERSFHAAEQENLKVCNMCQEDHTISHCKEFAKLGPKERSEYVKSKQLCFNCLAPGHTSWKCKLRMSCRICNGRHHSLLHEQRTSETAPSTSTNSPTSTPLTAQHVVEEEEEEEKSEEEEVIVNTMISSQNTRKNIALLATAIVEASNEQGMTIPLRALIDQGSQATFVSERAAQLLKLKRKPIKGTVIGVGSTHAEIKHMVQLQIGSTWDLTVKLPIQAYIIAKQLTTKLPSKTVPTQAWQHLEGLDLADPTYFKPGSIDLLLGVKEYSKILQQDIIKGPPGSPCAQKTSLGWILFGEITTAQQEDTYLVMHHQVDVDDMLKSIWEVEVDTKRQLTKEEKRCEEIYRETTKRNEEGRYIVKLPFKTDSPQSPYGNTKEIARQRFMQLERKFRRVPDLKKEYTKVINDYIQQKHLEKIPEKEKEDKTAVYLPHHAVIRNDKETSRTRTVFDASCKGTNNISLNDELLIGPQLQDDLRNLIIRWRMKRICFVADIQQMYRQILVTKEDSNFQRIFWRSAETEDLEEYRILRVTFGTAPAPFLAVRTLHQIAEDEANDNKKAIETIKTSFYMDDLLDGADTVAGAVTLAKDVTTILRKGGFILTKWSSNNLDFMKSIDEDKRSVNAHVNMNLDGTIKALGIIWNLNSDHFQYNHTLSPTPKTITKRSILSDIQKLFDPLGWIAPSTVMAKLMIQKLWVEGVDWDTKLDETLEEEWRRVREDFSNVKDIQIKRWIGTTQENVKNIQIHGFCDASMKAYGAAVYVRIENKGKNVETKLIAAKTRVAPLKTISLPRLELCGALLLSKLMKQVGQAMNISTTDMYAWTDSSIVIAWLSGEPNRWKPFVANRVVEILENINNKHWHHVESNLNPADLASRGMLLSELKECELWWRGPCWLSEKEINIKKQNKLTTDLEMKTIKVHTYLNTEDKKILENSITQKFEEFDDLPELLRVVSYCKRFLHHKKGLENIDKEFTTQELDDSLMTCIKRVQEEEFFEEIHRLKDGKQVKKNSVIRSLNPYLDEKQIIRVGGRLRHTNLPDEKKHPIILGNKNSLTPLIIADAHKRTMHGGVQLMLCYLRFQFWIIRAKGVVKKHIHRCLICAKLNAKAKTQLMGELPTERVTPSRAFLHSGVDFAGPFNILVSKGRGNKTIKAYVAIFICLATKAIHIELVGDMTSEAFIGAFRRFVARRGKCSHIWSDQGRNFVGADKELRDALNECRFQFSGPIAQALSLDGTQWHFIPAYGPNFGGLWEAGVKSLKHHMKRIFTTNLTFEEMTTILCQIEACLNSRPLCPLDNTDSDNLNPLTPGHFLIGEAPIVVPSPYVNNTSLSALSRWRRTQKLFSDLWQRWQDEYLTRLQQRGKWHKKEREFEIGEVVLIKTDNLPPGKWSLGRIVDKHPGPDGVSRVYSVKSGSTVIRRTISKLCELPINNTK